MSLRMPSDTKKGTDLLQEVYNGQHFADGVTVVAESKAAA